MGRAIGPATMSQPERTVLFKMPEARQARLVGLSGSVKGRVVPLSLGTFVIGRGETCDLRLKDAGVSREHAKIVAEGAFYTVEDHESRNGTLVNGQPIRRATLKEGDQVTLCNVTLKFTYEAVTSALPSEFSDDTDEVEEAPPSAVTSPGFPAARVKGPERTLLLVAVVASVVTVVAAGVVVVVVVSRPAPVVVVDTQTLRGGTEGAQVRPDVDAGTPLPVPPSPTPTSASVGSDAAGAADSGTIDAATSADSERDSPRSDAGQEDTAPPQMEESLDPPSRRQRGRRGTSAAASGWIAARTGVELARAPAAGKIVSISERAEAGQPFLAIEGQPPVEAPASGVVTAVVRVGDVVRRGQVVARIADTRARADLPDAMRRRARIGGSVEVRATNGSTTTAVIRQVFGSTVFVETGGTAVDAIRLQ